MATAKKQQQKEKGQPAEKATQPDRTVVSFIYDIQKRETDHKIIINLSANVLDKVYPNAFRLELSSRYCSMANALEVAEKLFRYDETFKDIFQNILEDAAYLVEEQEEQKRRERDLEKSLADLEDIMLADLDTTPTAVVFEAVKGAIS